MKLPEPNVVGGAPAVGAPAPVVAPVIGAPAVAKPAVAKPVVERQLNASTPPAVEPMNRQLNAGAPSDIVDMFYSQKLITADETNVTLVGGIKSVLRLGAFEVDLTNSNLTEIEVYIEGAYIKYAHGDKVVTLEEEVVELSTLPYIKVIEDSNISITLA